MKELKKKNPKHVNSSTVLLLYFIAFTCFFIAQKYQLPGLYDHVVRRLVTGPLDPAAGRQCGNSLGTDGSRTRLPGEAVTRPQWVLPACPKDHSNQTTLCQKHCPAPELRGRTPWGSVHSHHQTKFRSTLDHWPQSTPMPSVSSSFHMKSWSTPRITGELQIKITATCFIQKNYLRRIKPIHFKYIKFSP